MWISLSALYEYSSAVYTSSYIIDLLFFYTINPTHTPTCGYLFQPCTHTFHLLYTMLFESSYTIHLLSFLYYLPHTMSHMPRNFSLYTQTDTCGYLYQPCMNSLPYRTKCSLSIHLLYTTSLLYTTR